MKKKVLFFFFLIIVNFFAYSYFLSGNWKVILSSVNFLKPGHIITVHEKADSLYFTNIPFISKCVLHHNHNHNHNGGKNYSYCRTLYLNLFGIYKKPFILCQIHFSKLYVYEHEKMEIPSLILQRVDLYIFNI